MERGTGAADIDPTRSKPNQTKPTLTKLPPSPFSPLFSRPHPSSSQAMGQLLLTLACSVSAGAAPPSLDLASAHFSPDFVRCLSLLLGAAEGGAFSWRHFAAIAGERLMVALDGASSLSDALIADLGCELENGRLLRLLIKLGFINERPDGDGSQGAAAASSSGWSETGDRYLCKLFRDFVFHQSDPDTGLPRLDWGHVVEALNKLDAGAPEEVLLLSRDEQSMLVASYADVRRCVETSYAELKSMAAAASVGGGGGPGGGAGRGPRG